MIDSKGTDSKHNVYVIKTLGGFQVIKQGTLVQKRYGSCLNSFLPIKNVPLHQKPLWINFGSWNPTMIQEVP